MSFSTQNIPIATADTSGLLATLATQMFEAWNPEMGDAIINKNFTLTWMKAHAEKTIVGGLDFAEPVLKAVNTNFGFRDKYAQIPANYQQPTDAFRFQPAVLTGVIPINKVHELQNQGRAEIRKFLETLKKQAESTVSNQVSAAMWNASPVTDVDPESLLSIISSTPTTGSIGGISRVSNVFARNKVNSTTVSSVGSAAGLAALYNFRAQLGGAANDTPDFAVTTSTIFGNIVGFFAGTNRRMTADETMTKAGIDSVQIMPRCELGYDGDAGLASDASSAACPANNLFFLNSRHLFYKVLSGGNMKYDPFSVKDNSINSTAVFYHIYNLTTNLPSSLGVMTAITG